MVGDRPNPLALIGLARRQITGQLDVGIDPDVKPGVRLSDVDDIDVAMKTIPSSVAPKLMKQYEDFAKTRFG